MPGLARPDAESGGQVGLAGPGWAGEPHVVPGGHEVEGAEVGDGVPLEGVLVGEVEVVERLPGRESGGPDPDLPAVGRPGGHLTFQAGSQELLVGPVLAPSPFAQAIDGGCQGRRLEGPAQVGEICGLLGGRHQAAPVARS